MQQLYLQGTRNRGKPRKRWRDESEEDVNIIGIRNRQAMFRYRREWTEIVLEARVHYIKLQCLRRRRRRRSRRRRSGISSCQSRHQMEMIGQLHPSATLPSVSNEQKTWWAPETVWTLRNRNRSLAQVGNRAFTFWGTWWHSWLKHCAKSRKVAGSIPDGVIGIFHSYNPSGRNMALGLTHPLTEMSTRTRG
jgi:hypothetical protein